MKGTRTESGFYEFAITPDWIELAEWAADQVPDLKNSIRGRKGRIVGALGEIAFSVLADLEPFTHATYDYDFIYDGLRYDVKTKDRTVPVRPTYEASAYAKNIQQDYDIYVACSLFRDKATQMYQSVTIIGWITKEDYKTHSTFLPVGSIDPSNGWEVAEACYNCDYKHFTPFD